MSFGKNLASFRKEKGLTQQDLVELSGVGIAQIRRYESGKASPTLDTIVKLARSLGVSIDLIVFDKASEVAADRIADNELLEQFEIISGMDEEDKYIVKQVLDGIIVKNQVEKMIRPRPKPEKFGKNKKEPDSVRPPKNKKGG